MIIRRTYTFSGLFSIMLATQARGAGDVTACFNTTNIKPSVHWTQSAALSAFSTAVDFAAKSTAMPPAHATGFRKFSASRIFASTSSPMALTAILGLNVIFATWKGTPLLFGSFPGRPGHRGWAGGVGVRCRCFGGRLGVQHIDQDHPVLHLEMRGTEVIHEKHGHSW